MGIIFHSNKRTQIGEMVSTSNNVHFSQVFMPTNHSEKGIFPSKDGKMLGTQLWLLFF